MESTMSDLDRSRKRLRSSQPFDAIAPTSCPAILTAAVTGTCAALGETAGTAEFFHGDVELPTSSSLSEEFMRGTEGLRRSEVSVITIDEFVEQHSLPRVDLAKIDTESTEPAVLRGMLTTLRRDQPTLVCEVLRARGSERALEEILEPLGYRYYLLTPSGPELRSRIEGHPEWFNYLFSPRPPEEVARL
jgi:FkbM family methyltransferase